MSDNRFMRTQMLLGDEAMANLASSKVMIIGLGAVGGYALEAVARAGVGNLILVDFDRFDLSNINRQILALETTVGRLKTEVAQERVKAINPQCHVVIKTMCINSENIADLMAEKPDFVIDAIDSLSAKCALMYALWKAEIPSISSMGAALKTDSSCIRQSTLDKSKNCGLAKQIRNRLRKLGANLKQVQCVYSDEQVELPPSAIKASSSPAQKRNIIGSMPTITAIFGLTLANYAILHLSKTKS